VGIQSYLTWITTRVDWSTKNLTPVVFGTGSKCGKRGWRDDRMMWVYRGWARFTWQDVFSLLACVPASAPALPHLCPPLHLLAPGLLLRPRPSPCLLPGTLPLLLRLALFTQRIRFTSCAHSCFQLTLRLLVPFPYLPSLAALPKVFPLSPGYQQLVSSSTSLSHRPPRQPYT